MNKIIACGALALCSLGAWGSDSTRQDLMSAMDYVDEQRCFIAMDSSVQSIMPLLALAWLNATDAESRRRAREAFDVALARGCDINAADLNGLSALNHAILKGDGDMVQYLLAHDANPKQIIETEDAAIRGMDSFALLDKLEETDTQTNRERVRAALDTRKK